VTNRGKIGHDNELRRRAEEQLAARDARESPIERDLPRLVHELEVHQIELEMQNEELRRSRLELEDALRRYTELFDFAPIGYVVVDHDGVVSAINLAGAHMLGGERQTLAGSRFIGFVEPRHHTLFRTFLMRVLVDGGAGEPSERCELQLLGSDREPFDALLTAAMVGAAASALMIAFQDVAAQKRAEAALQAEGRHKDEFMAVLSHELRNPLSPIRSSLFVLERAEPGSEQARHALAIIDRQVEHLTHIVDDLLDITRIAHGKVRLQRERLELSELMRRTIEDHRPAYEASGVALAGRSSVEPLWVDADETRLIQVAGNLLGNALKFTPRGGRVEVAVRRDGDSATLSVTDTGAGIAPDVRERVFEAFAQGPQTLDRAHGGLGLGLAMAKGLVELHGGTIEAASEGIGKGSTFTMRLPLATGVAEPVQPATTAEEPAQCVLVIEDNLDAAESLRDVLALQGHKVHLALDGPTGLTLAHELRPDVVLCDIGLPGMDGYEVARAIREDPELRSTYLVALSGYARPEDRHRAVAAGFDRHIAKPPTLKQLRKLREPPSIEA
jgi:signal transduction histidine kinase